MDVLNRMVTIGLFEHVQLERFEKYNINRNARREKNRERNRREKFK